MIAVVAVVIVVVQVVVTAHDEGGGGVVAVVARAEVWRATAVHTATDASADAVAVAVLYHDPLVTWKETYKTG